MSGGWGLRVTEGFDRRRRGLGVLFTLRRGMTQHIGEIGALDPIGAVES